MTTKEQIESTVLSLEDIVALADYLLLPKIHTFLHYHDDIPFVYFKMDNYERQIVIDTHIEPMKMCDAIKMLNLIESKMDFHAKDLNL